MKHCFLITSCALFFTATSVFAEGLPANPWATKQEVIDNTVFHASRDDLVRSAPMPAQNTDTNTEKRIRELENVTASLKEKWQQSSQTQIQEPKNDDTVNAADAIKALDTLSRYMNRNNTQSDTSSSPDFSALKQKFSNMTANNNNQGSAQNSEMQRKINKMKYEYNHYKSQINSDYNSIKNKAKPMIDTMKNSVKEAEKATGVKF